VVVGGGFGGLPACRFLGNLPVDVTLIDRRNHHLFQPLLYQVATGILSPGQIAPPLRHVLRKHKNVKVELAEVDGFDLDRKVVFAKQLGLREMEIPYDSLIVAAGANQSYFGHDEFALFAPGMKTIDDALELEAAGCFAIVFEAVPAAITEAIVEKLDIKRDLFALVLGFSKPNTIISSNTSGIPIKAMAEGMSEGFRKHFLGTHFFNPPRYLKLLEVISTADTLPEVTALIADFCDRAENDVAIPTGLIRDFLEREQAKLDAAAEGFEPVEQVGVDFRNVVHYPTLLGDVKLLVDGLPGLDYLPKTRQILHGVFIAPARLCNQPLGLAPHRAAAERSRPLADRTGHQHIVAEKLKLVAQTFLQLGQGGVRLILKKIHLQPDDGFPLAVQLEPRIVHAVLVQVREDLVGMQRPWGREQDLVQVRGQSHAGRVIHAVDSAALAIREGLHAAQVE
jgi:hypothetical protein